jgi:hypothetical protein
MRRLMVHLMAEVDFEDGDEASDKAVQNYQKHLSEDRSERGPRALAPSDQGDRIESVSVAEIKAEL